MGYQCPLPASTDDQTLEQHGHHPSLEVFDQTSIAEAESQTWEEMIQAQKKEVGTFATQNLTQ
jgi:hypothetical protein